MIRAFFLIILISSSLAQAESSYHNPIETAFSRFEAILPPKIAETWRENDHSITVRLKPNVTGCARYYAKTNSSDPIVKVTEQYIDISRSCINQIDKVSATFTIQEVAENELLRSLYRVAVQLWLEKPDNNLNKTKIKKLVYANHYYLTPLTMNVDINDTAQNSLLNFWATTSLAFMTDPALVTRHPDVYILLRDNFFDGTEYFSNTLSPADLGRTSAEMYPTFAKLKFLRAGNEAWYMRYQLVKSAKKSIDVEYFTLADDIFGQSFVALLLEAMKRGVHVKVMLDGRGSFTTSRGRLMRTLSAAGAETVSYNPLLLGVRNLFKFFSAGPINAFVAANHDKVLLVDDTKLITGGRNMSGRYFLRANEFNKKTYRDADIYAEFKEPFIAAISAFNSEFYSEHSFRVYSSSAPEVIETTAACNSSLVAIEDRMNNEVLSAETLATHPEVEKFKSLVGYRQFDPKTSDEYFNVKCLDKTSMLLDQNNFSETLFALIRSSKRIVIQNPYVTLTKRLKAALIEAAQGGAQIYLSTASPGTSDNAVTQAVFMHEWKKLMKQIPNLKIYAYKGASNLHAKIFVFDAQKVIVSGYNLDSLSERFNSEFGLLVDSAEFANLVETTVLKMMNSDSQEYDADRNVGPESIYGSGAKNGKYGFFYLISGLISSWL